jgi:hypothetical protein
METLYCTDCINETTIFSFLPTYSMPPTPCMLMLHIYVYTPLELQSQLILVHKG